MNIKYQFLFLMGILFTITACNLERVVDINLPEYVPELVVESYLKPGEPYRLLLTESRPFFGTQDTDLPIVTGATVTITHQGNTVTLTNGFFFDAFGKIYNYGSTEVVPANFTDDFQLEVVDSLGRKVTATTTIPEPLAMDSSVATVSGDSSMFILTYWTDNPDTENYYRRMLHRTHPIGDSLVIDFVLDDQVINGAENQIVTGSPPFFEQGDTVVVSLYHITADYNDYVETVQAAVANNGNPFGQPGVIISNIEGGIGIFTGVTLDQEYMILD